MIHSLAARVFLMVAQGVSIGDALDWVLRRFHKNLVGYWRKLLMLELIEAMG